MRHARLVLILLVTVLLAWACARDEGAFSKEPGGRSAGAGPSPTASPGFRFTLSEGVEGGARQTPLPAPPAQPLPESEVKAILSRLPAFQAGAATRTEFALRAGSLPAPRTGTVAKQPFPPPPSDAARPEVEKGPLEVVRHAPAGDVPIAPDLSVTFNQPMVPVTSQDEAAKIRPVKLTPEPKGRWRWIGTKTILFDPDVRFPMATRYQVEVPAGTRSETGGTLAKGLTWTFTTPPPKLESSAPGGDSQPLDPVMIMVFNQRIDPAAVLRTIKVTAGGQSVAVRPATDEEVAADATAQAVSSGAEPGRWLALKPVAPLPGDSSIQVTLGPGTPSAEGPLTTTEAQGFGFQTYGPLTVVEHHCGWGGKDCPPLTPWRIRFSNPLDAEALDPQQVRVSPELKGMKVSCGGDWLTIQGMSKGRTTYQVTLDRSIKDVFGQTLGKDVTVTMTVGPATPALFTVGGPMVVVDPKGKPSYSVYTVNQPAVKVRLYQVTPDDWSKWLDFQQNSWRDDPPPPPGRKVFDDRVKVSAPADEFAETPIDLSPALTNGKGHVVVVVEPTAGEKDRYRPHVAAWAQVTGIGLTALSDAETLVAFASNLEDGRPLEGVKVGLPAGPSGTTDAQGVARFPLPGEASLVLTASRDGDVAMLPGSAYGGTSWYRQSRSDRLVWFVFDDRGIYKPGETARLKGWIRRWGAGTKGDIGSLQGAAAEVRWTLKDSRYNDVATGTAPLNAMGGFDLSVKMTDTMNLGTASITFETAGGSGGVDGTSHAHQFMVEEFRRPEFEVSASAAEGPHFIGGSATATVTASYYAGGGLPNAETNWSVSATPGHFSPPGWSEFTFGTWTPWWDYGFFRQPDLAASESLAGKTDPAGKHVVKMDFLSVYPPRPWALEAAAAVTDVNRQTWSATANLLVHPGSHYVGLKSERTFVEAGKPLELQAIVADLDGKAQAGRKITVRSARLDYDFKNGQWVSTEKDVKEQTVTSGGQPVEVTVRPSEGGTYKVTATVEDPQGRPNQSELTLWVAGGKTPRARGVEQEQAALVPDRKEYRPGQTAEILVQSPFAPAEGVLTLQRSGLVKTERFSMSGPSHTLKIPIEESYLPNLYVKVDLVGQADREEEGAGKRPAYASGSLNLAIPPFDRALKLEVKPREAKLEPGGSTVLDVKLQDAAGKPVAGGEVAVVVADEAVLALTGYDLADPLYVFYNDRSPDVQDAHLRGYVQLAAAPEAASEDEAMQKSGRSRRAANGDFAEEGMVGGAPPPAPAPMAAPMAEAPAESKAAPGGGGQPGPAIRVRTDFNPLALFKADLPTDASGAAQVTLKVPDNLTRYRIMAVAVAGGRQFGDAESTVTARLPLMVRPSAPRFLNFGDRFELPVVLQNGTDQPLEVSVAVRTANLTLTEGQGRKLTVPANDRVEVRFPAAAEEAGKAAFQVGAVAGSHEDAAEGSLPVWTPATTEAFATYGQIDDGAMIQSVQAPKDVFTQFGGLEVTTSSTALQELTDAVLYLVAYPFECAEQISSRVLAIAALKDVLTAFEAEGLPSAKEMVAAVKRDVERLQTLQRPDGGFGLWRRDDREFPYVSVHVAHALVRAKAKGFAVPADMLERAKGYLRTIDQHIPSDYSDDCRRTIVAYALNVRHLMGDPDPTRARNLVKEAGLERLSLEAVGWILPTLSQAKAPEVAAIRRLLDNRVTETAGTAHFVTSYGDDAWLLLSSDRRVDGVLLDALIQDQPKSDLIPKIVRGLLAHRTRGRWGNTQENVFILLALDRYFNTYEKVTPDFVARLWLGNQFAGEQKFQGRSTESKQLDVPMAWLAKEAKQDLVLSKQGPGRLYYRLGMRYAPKDLSLAPADHGFAVERAYEAVDDPAEVKRDADGTWRIQAGSRVRVRVTMVAPTRRYHVALVDPLPAGLEALNPALAVTEKIPPDTAQPRPGDDGPGWWYWFGPWYEHTNLRDERAEAFASLLWEGVHEYTYVARATTPGQFVVPPPKAEEMYHPETFGRGATARVIVE